VIAAMEVDDRLEGDGLLWGCKHLLEASNLLITFEEEVLCLMDTGTRCYSHAHKNGKSCWQQHFSGQV
jgi:hypothetical protein